MQFEFIYGNTQVKLNEEVEKKIAEGWKRISHTCNFVQNFFLMFFKHISIIGTDNFNSSSYILCCCVWVSTRYMGFLR